MSFQHECKRIKFTPKEKEYAENLSSAILSGTIDEIDYNIAKKFWPKILKVIR